MINYFCKTCKRYVQSETVTRTHCKLCRKEMQMMLPKDTVKSTKKVSKDEKLGQIGNPFKPKPRFREEEGRVYLRLNDEVPEWNGQSEKTFETEETPRTKQPGWIQ